MRTMFFGAAVAALAVACGGGQQTGPAPGTASTTAAAGTTAPAPSTTDTSPAPSGTGSAQPAQSFGDKMRATGMGMMQAAAAHDADKMASFYTSDAVMKAYGLPDSVGRDQIKAHFQMGFTAFPDMQFKPTRIFIHDHLAAVEGVVTGTMKGDLGPLKATGRTMGLPVINVLTYNDDGLVKEEHRYFDMHTQMEQLDPKAKPGTFRPVASLPTGDGELHVSKGTPDEASNTQVVTGMYAAMAGGKSADGFLALLTDDVTWDDSAAPGPSTGKPAAKQYFDMMGKAFPDAQSTINTTIAADDFVVVESTFTGTNKGPMPPMLNKATGKSVTGHGCDVIELKAGKIAHGWGYSNGYEFAQQLGLAPPPGGH